MVFVPVAPTSDADWYFIHGLEIASGQGYHEGPWPTAFWPIGYPLFLAAVFFCFGHQLIFAQSASLILSCLAFPLTYRVARHMAGNELVARFAVLLLTIYPNQIAYSGVLFSEPFATFLLLLACDVFMSRPGLRSAALAGLLFGVGALVKAQFLLLPGMLLIPYGWRFWRSWRNFRRVVLLGVVFGAGIALAVLPLTARNYMVFHRFILISTNGGITFLTGNNPQADGDFTPDNSLTGGAYPSARNQVAEDARDYALAENWIRENPGRFLELVPLKIWRLWAPDGEGEWWFERGYAGYEQHAPIFHALRIINQAYYTVLIAGAALAFVLLVKRRFTPHPWMAIGFLFFAYITLISVVYSGQSRFHFPAMPFVIIYCSWFLLQRFVPAEP